MMGRSNAQAGVAVISVISSVIPLMSLFLLSCDRPKPPDLKTAKGFSILVAEGNGRDGYGTWSIDEHGLCEYLEPYQEWGKFPNGDPFLERRWRKLTLVLEPEIVSRLRALLSDGSFFSLNPHYSDDDVADGVVMLVKVLAGDESKSVRCNNEFPKPVRELRAFLKKNVLEAFEQEIKSAPPIPEPDQSVLEAQFADR